MLLANSLSGIFGNHASSLGIGSPFGGGNPLGNNAPVEETVINNYYGDSSSQPDNSNDVQQADYDDSADDDFDQGDDGSFA
ncbi:hypothetical protein D3C86_1791290 [compost metagenome]